MEELSKNTFTDAATKIADGLAKLGHEIANNEALRDLGEIVADHFKERAIEVASALTLDAASKIPYIDRVAEGIEKTPAESILAMHTTESFIDRLLQWGDKQQGLPPGTSEEKIKDGLGELYDNLMDQIKSGLDSLFGQPQQPSDDLLDYLAGLTGQPTAVSPESYGGLIGGGGGFDGGGATGGWGPDGNPLNPATAPGTAGGLVGQAGGVPVSSPIVFDLDGDGISLVEMGVGAAAAYFDLDNDGFREKTQWVAPTDGLLALDANANGRIDDKTELFGDEAGFADGYAKLRTYDANADSVIDAQDAVFGDLRIWQDADNVAYSRHQV